MFCPENPHKNQVNFQHFKGKLFSQSRCRLIISCVMYYVYVHQQEQQQLEQE